MLPRYPTASRATRLPSDASNQLWQTPFYCSNTFYVCNVLLQSWNTDMGKSDTSVLMATIGHE